MTDTHLRCQDIEELDGIADELLSLGAESPLFVFSGELGAGKTTLIKALCKRLGVTEGVSSPTYNIVNEYKAGDRKIYHFDLYRLKNPEELYDIGFEEYLHSGNICFIEWPEIAGNFFVQAEINHVQISREDGSDARLIHISRMG